MSSVNWLQFMNAALGACTIGHIPHDSRVSRQSFGFGPQALNIVGDESRRAFEKSVDQLLGSSVGSTLSKKTLTNKLVPLLHAKKLAGGEFAKKDADDFRASLEGIPMVEHRVIRDIFGASISKSSGPLKISCFKIYEWQRDKNTISGRGDADDQWVWPGDDKHSLLIECKVTARDAEKATELADVLFARFELIVRFIIGHRTTKFDVAVLNHNGSKIKKSYVFTDQSISSNHSLVGAIEVIPLDDDYFVADVPPFSRLLAIVGKDHSTAFEKKLMRSAEWTGQAMADPNPASAFIKAATALEVLFSVNEKGVITPSIMAQISECCAHILGKTPQGCVEVERLVKSLYSTRSSVVHFGKDDVSLEDLNTFIFLARSVVMALLTDSKYTEIDVIEKLYDMLRIKKYSVANAAQDIGMQESADN